MSTTPVAETLPTPGSTDFRSSRPSGGPVGASPALAVSLLVLVARPGRCEPFSSPILPYDAYRQDILHRNEPPSAAALARHRRARPRHRWRGSQSARASRSSSRHVEPPRARHRRHRRHGRGLCSAASSTTSSCASSTACTPFPRPSSRSSSRPWSRGSLRGRGKRPPCPACRGLPPVGRPAWRAADPGPHLLAHHLAARPLAGDLTLKNTEYVLASAPGRRLRLAHHPHASPAQHTARHPRRRDVRRAQRDPARGGP